MEARIIEIFTKNAQIWIASKSLHPENSQQTQLKSFIRFKSFSVYLGLSSCERKMQMWFCIDATFKVNGTFEGQEPTNMFWHFLGFHWVRWCVWYGNVDLPLKYYITDFAYYIAFERKRLKLVTVGLLCIMCCLYISIPL